MTGNTPPSTGRHYFVAPTGRRLAHQAVFWGAAAAARRCDKPGCRQPPEAPIHLNPNPGKAPR